MASGKVLKSLHIGVGGRGQWPIQLATPAVGFAPTILCDPNTTVLDHARQACHLEPAACHTDLGTALPAALAAGVDCAIICAPTYLHVSLVKRCVEAGVRNVLVEKGMAPTWDDARAGAVRGGAPRGGRRRAKLPLSVRAEADPTVGQ